MLNNKTLVAICLVLASGFHFIFYFGWYGPSKSIFIWNFIIAWGAVFLLLFFYALTNWKSGIKGKGVTAIFGVLILLLFIALIRSLLKVNDLSSLVRLLFDSYTGLSLFPILFFVIGSNSKYFLSINRILTVYCIVAFAISLAFLNYFELNIFLLMPISYLILTFPMQSNRNRILTLIISVVVIVVSWTNRAGVMRILISYVIVIIYYVISSFKVNKKLIRIVVFCILLLPFYFLYLGINGKNIFADISGDPTEDYSQSDLSVDTRTFLYYEVFQDLKFNNAFVFGKGIDGGYASEIFQTFSRSTVEVGFLQILLKTGIVGFLAYFAMLFSAIFKALGRSKSIFMKSLGLLLSSYVLMLFIENSIAFNLLNVSIWLVVGMCHSRELLNLNDEELKKLYSNIKVKRNLISA